MNIEKAITAEELNEFSIKVKEPFAEFLMADKEEYEFAITLLDVVRFAGHACPTMIGSFLMAQRAVKELFPATNTCVRGEVAVELPAAVEQGATGPISNVFSMIFGAWEKSGFGGLQGRFVRRNLLQYSSPNIPRGTFRFHHVPTGNYVDLSYDSSKAQVLASFDEVPFQKIWRLKITKILQNPDEFVSVHNKLIR